MKFIKTIYYFFFFKKFFKLNKKFFFKNIFNNFDKIFICLNCHKNKNIPLIKNQKKIYLKNSLISYKKFDRKSFYMNFICKDLSKINIKNILKYFNE